MEVSGLTDQNGPVPRLDLTRLSPDEWALWDRFFAPHVEAGKHDGLVVWGFGYACMLELSGPPDVVNEYLKEHDPDNTIAQYLENVRRADRRRLEDGS